VRIDNYNLERLKRNEINIADLLRFAWPDSLERRFVMDLILYITAGYKRTLVWRALLWFTAGVVAGAIGLVSAQRLGIL